MLDSFEILTTSGVVIWSKAYVPVNSSLINGFIRDVFIEEKVVPGAGAIDDAPAARNPAYKKEKHTLKWASVKDLGLIFIVSIASPRRTFLQLIYSQGSVPITYKPFVGGQTLGQYQNALRRPLR